MDINVVSGMKSSVDTEIPMDIDLNVSASEESKGGIKYEVLIGDPKVVTPLRASTNSGARPVSAEEIQLKINAATERRHSFEAERLAALSEKLRRIEEAAKKRVEITTSTKENLEQKIETRIESSTAKRETLISDMKTKLSSHNTNHLQEVRSNHMTSLTEFEEKVKQEMQAKLEIAEKNREKVLQEKLETLKKHDEKVEMVRTKRNSAILVEEPVPETENAQN